MSDVNITNIELEQRNKRLLGEIESLQKQIFDAHDTNKALNEILEEKKHSEQLAGWAIDRALELNKLLVQAQEGAGHKEIRTVQGIIDDAQKLCDWIKESSAAPRKSKSSAQETMQ